MKTPKTLVAAIAAMASTAIMPLASQAADVDWIGGSGGTEAEPLDLYKASNWSNNA